MHPYITQLLMNERVAERHRNAAARRVARQARLLARLAERATAPKRPALPIAEPPRQARLGSTSRSARPARHSLQGRGTALALATPPGEDITEDDQALCGICDDL
jgi:hypothetical protein